METHAMSLMTERRNFRTAKAASARPASGLASPLLIGLALAALAIIGCAVAATWYPVDNLTEMYYVGP
jgi:hypothetical protein